MVDSTKNWKVIASKFIQADMNYEVEVVRLSVYKQMLDLPDKSTIIRLPYRPTIGQLISCPNLH